MQLNDDYIEPFTNIVFDENTLLSAKNMNKLGSQYIAGQYLLLNHNHNDNYHTKEESDNKYFYTDNKDGSDADTIDGYHLSEISGSAIPKYGVIFWEDPANIPAGFAICNGQTVNGAKTPDLRDYFIAGAGLAYALDDIFGSNLCTLTGLVTINSHIVAIEEMPTHRHTFTDEKFTSRQKDLAEEAYYGCVITGVSSTAAQNTSYVGSGQGHNHTATITLDQINIDNRPSYYSLIAIMKVV